MSPPALQALSHCCFAVATIILGAALAVAAKRLTHWQMRCTACGKRHSVDEECK